MSTLKVVSLNIEGSRHLERVIPFLKLEKADIVCLQEVMEEDIKFFRKEFEGVYYFTPMTQKKYGDDNSYVDFGTLIFTSYKSRLVDTDYYFFNSDDSQEMQYFNREDINGSVNNALTVVEVENENITYKIATIHFTWSKDGEANDEQRRDWKELLKKLQKHKEIVFCGDFNMPRGREMFSCVTEYYKDNIPKDIESSLDPQFHRVPELRYMVDGLFSTDGYVVSNVEMKCGISDHCAVTGHIEKVASA